MTKDQKIDFIHDLINAVKKRTIDRVNEMPEEWDGHELRRYLADKFTESTSRYLKGKRLKDYKNEVLVRNL